jgi:hypothetical protein
VRYYFAAQFARNPEMRKYRDELLAAKPDHVVTSRWIDQHGGQQESAFSVEVLTADPENCWKFGQHDLEDLDNSDTIVAFTGSGSGGKGGRHVEWGYAIAQALRLVVIGPRDNIFYTHPDAERYENWEEFFEKEV